MTSGVTAPGHTGNDYYSVCGLDHSSERRVFVGIRKGDSFAVSGDRMTNGNEENVFVMAVAQTLV